MPIIHPDRMEFIKGGKVSDYNLEKHLKNFTVKLYNCYNS
jgi:hypothetical protein